MPNKKENFNVATPTTIIIISIIVSIISWIVYAIVS